MALAPAHRADCRDVGLTTSHHVLDKITALHSARARLSATADATTRYPAHRDIKGLNTELAACTAS